MFIGVAPMGRTREEDSTQKEEENAVRESRDWKGSGRVHKRVDTTPPGENKEARAERRIETSLGGEASWEIDSSWDHPVCFDGQEAST